MGPSGLYTGPNLWQRLLSKVIKRADYWKRSKVLWVASFGNRLLIIIILREEIRPTSFRKFLFWNDKFWFVNVFLGDFFEQLLNVFLLWRSLDPLFCFLTVLLFVFFFERLCDFALFIFYPICTPLPSGKPSEPKMLAISLHWNVNSSFFPSKFSNFPVFLISLKKKFGRSTVRLMVVSISTTELKVPVMIDNFSPLYGREITLSSAVNFWVSLYPFRLHTTMSPFTKCSCLVWKWSHWESLSNLPTTWISS